MKFYLAQYVSESVVEKSQVIHSVSQELERCLLPKSYSKLVDALYIGVVCVEPHFESHIRPRNKFTRSKKIVEYSFSLDLDEFTQLNDPDVPRVIVRMVVETADNINRLLPFPEFDIAAYRADITACSKDTGWL